MRLVDFLAILGVSCVFGFMLFSFGEKLLPAVGISLLMLVIGLSMLNYLNHGKLRPFVRRSPCDDQ